MAEKRTRLEFEECNQSQSDSKRLRIESFAPTAETAFGSGTDRISLFELPDCVFETIFQYLPAIDLFQISRTCKRLKLLTRRTKFWTCMNGMSHDTKFRSKAEASLFMENLNSKTVDLRIAATGPHSAILSPISLKLLTDFGDNLTILALENQKLNSLDFRSNMLSKSLKELSLKNTTVRNSMDFFFNIHVHLENLHTLILDRCYWVVGHSLMAIAKLPCLVNLSLADCLGIEDSFVYISLSMRFGFKNLRRIDLRRITCVRSFLDSLKGTPKVHEVYLERATMKKRNEFDDKFNDILKASPSAVLCTQSTNVAEVTFRVEIYDMHSMLMKDFHSAISSTGEILLESCSNMDDDLLAVNSSSLIALLRTRILATMPPAAASVASPSPTAAAACTSSPTNDGSDDPQLFRPGFALQKNGDICLVARNFNRVTDRFINLLTARLLSRVRKFDFSGCAFQSEVLFNAVTANFPSIEWIR